MRSNLLFVGELLCIVAAVFAAAYGLERIAQKRNGESKRGFGTKKIAMVGMFGAVSAILMLLEIPVPFAPPFYKLDFSELPVLICTFAFGPAAGVMTEFVKIVLKLFFKSTSTAFVGELANFVIGCSFLLPASAVYLFRKNKKTAIVGTVVGTLCMTVVGTAFNAVYLLPKFAELYGMPLDAIIAMGSEINARITNISSLVIFAVAPLNLIKGAVDSAVTILIYKKLSPILKEDHAASRKKTEKAAANS